MKPVRKNAFLLACPLFAAALLALSGVFPTLRTEAAAAQLTSTAGTTTAVPATPTMPTITPTPPASATPTLEPTVEEEETPPPSNPSRITDGLTLMGIILVAIVVVGVLLGGQKGRKKKGQEK